jgi:hypothetical protein
VTGERRPRIRRWAANAMWIILAVPLFAISTNVFGGYPQAHSDALDWIAVVVIVVLGIAVWFKHERRDEEP